MPESRSLTVSFVSGKGGVGKTMLAVAFAYEISRTARTLLVDLDFFNRGLTGLMRHGETIQHIPQPEFLIKGSTEKAASWELVKVAPNVVHLCYPDLLPDQIAALEETDAQKLSDLLKKWIDQLRADSGCEVVVLDCHGGPDRLSFAACLISDHSIMVSEPDKITFYGTLHFMRQLERLTLDAGRKPDIRLVFNKVVPAFSVPYLKKFYDGEVRRYFNGQPLLAVFPLEVYLTKEFERTPFLTAVYPFSQLAKKTHVLLYDLLLPRSRQWASALTPTRSLIRLWITRNSLGRTPRIIDLNYILPVVAIGALICGGVNIYATKIAIPQYEQARQDASDALKDHLSELTAAEFEAAALHRLRWYDRAVWSANRYLFEARSAGAAILAVAALFWFLAGLILTWSSALDRTFTYQARRGHRLTAVGLFIVVLALWLFPLLVVAALMAGGSWDTDALKIPSAIVLTTVIFHQTLIAIQNFKFERRAFEGMARVIFAVYLVVIPIIGGRVLGGY